MPTLGTTWYEPLSPADATFLSIENSRAHMHIGGVFLLEGRAPPYREFADHLASRLDRVPRYRQRLAFVPLGLGRPVWVDDPIFQIEHHVRYERASEPGEAALNALAARSFAVPLDRESPLWEMTLVDGIGEDRFAILWKTHHCVLDGIAFLDVIDAFTDPSPDAAAPRSAARWEPRAAPPATALLAASINEQVSRTLDLAGGALRGAERRRKQMSDLAEGLRPLLALTLAGPARRTSLNQPIGPTRRWDMLSLDLETIKRVRGVFGTTVNDVVLAVVAGALRRLLGARGEDLHSELRVFVPVNVRNKDAKTSCGNQIGAVYCPLPVGEPDPVARLRAISASMARLKEGKGALGTATFVRLAELVPARVAAEMARREAASHRFNLVVSNVPGPPCPRWLLGKKLRSLHFAVPLSDDQTLSLQFFSYAGSVGVGLLADAGSAPDLPVLAAAIAESMQELAAAEVRSP